MNLVKLSWKNIAHRRLSSSLSIILLSGGMAIILIALLTKKQLEERFKENANKVDLVVAAKGSRQQSVLCNVLHLDQPTGNVNFQKVKFLQKHPFVSWAVPISLGDNFKGFRIVGTSHQFFSIYDAQIAKGRLWEKPMEVVVGARLATDLGLKIGDKFTGGHGLGESLHSHDEFKYEVVGIAAISYSVMDNLLLTDVESVWLVHSGENHKAIGSFDVKPDLDSVAVHDKEEKKDHHHGHNHHHHDHHPIDAEKVLSELDTNQLEVTAMLVKYKTPRGRFTLPGTVNKLDELMAAEPAIEIYKIMQLVEPAVAVIGVMALFIMLIAALSIFVSMLNSLKDREYEIALMRLVGAGAIKVFAMIMIESLLLSVIGFMVGFVLSHFGMELLSSHLVSAYHYHFTGLLFIVEEIYLLLGIVLIGMVSAIYPAIKAYRVDISKTLSND